MQKEHKYVKVASYEPKPEEVKKVVLLYSGGLDTSVMLKWIQEVYKAQVIALTIDIGQLADDLKKIKEKALKLGAKKAIVIDAKDEFAENYITKGIWANADYQRGYHMSTPIGRPLLAKLAVKTAFKEKADTIAHGATGKGNDQVRIEGTALALNPDIKIIAPVREWGMGRDEELDYARKHKIPVHQTSDSPYSYDDNMWGVTGESGEIEDPEMIPPLEKILQICTLPKKAPQKEEIVEMEFVKGIPRTLNKKSMKLADLIIKANKIGAKHGIGISHHIEDRVVGLKVRGIYEMPGATMIIKAHRNLEKYVSTSNENRVKAHLDQEWSYFVYGGLWYDPVMRSIGKFNETMNQKVNGKVTLRLFKGNCEVVAIKAPDALFDAKLATFMKSDLFNQNASPGFIELWTLQMKMAKQTRKNILLAIGDEDNRKALLPYIKKVVNIPCNLYATETTSKFLDKHKISNRLVYKISQEEEPNIKTYLDQYKFDLVINIPHKKKDKMERIDGPKIRKKTIEKGIRLVTDLEVAKNLLNRIEESMRDKQF
ncbi:MAG: argininosuccinate synthase [Candidatus Moranbacteria bacterium]|nr:argininosuccinate synthase [Candidatus Moranbacteria bacterium]